MQCCTADFPIPLQTTVIKTVVTVQSEQLFSQKRASEGHQNYQHYNWSGSKFTVWEGHLVNEQDLKLPSANNNPSARGVQHVRATASARVWLPFHLPAGALCCLWSQSWTWRSSDQAWALQPAGPGKSWVSPGTWERNAPPPPSWLCWRQPWLRAPGWRGILGCQGCSVHYGHLRKVGEVAGQRVWRRTAIMDRRN